MTGRFAVLAALFTLYPSFLLAQVPDSQPAGRDPNARQGRRARQLDGSPEDRRSRRLQRMVDSAARSYELDESQKDLVRREVESMQKERRAAMGPDADRYDRLQQQLRAAMRNIPAGETRDQRRERLHALRNDPKLEEARKELREIESKFPFRWQDTVKRIETLLPPDQVAKAHARNEERARRWEERRRQRAESPPTDAGNPGSTPSTGSERRARRPGRDRAAPPQDPWEQHVKKFIADYGLLPVQQNAALAILKDQQARAAQLEKANADRLAAARQIPDRAEREKRLAELNKPTDQLFDELKTRLDALLTTDQRARGKSR